MSRMRACIFERLGAASEIYLHYLFPSRHVCSYSCNCTALGLEADTPDVAIVTVLAVSTSRTPAGHVWSRPFSFLPVEDCRVSRMHGLEDAWCSRECLRGCLVLGAESFIFAILEALADAFLVGLTLGISISDELNSSSTDCFASWFSPRTLS
ncbi:hypothetical protein BGZ61DRAFT_446193 [Ilyonectria robusta]|uniref:uncharacterized protein n=1 Tax=Ilyonectria robusta TaxID=1079257 RepID=UPI001E8CED4A|nr:uncharacterized protein BGZ61DRAFT_446193 [Ilyonectria robusta]KAH8729339.1 hypothetical protein BGZ61DRAFT_446193 [Ilyonectria robusta]